MRMRRAWMCVWVAWAVGAPGHLYGEDAMSAGAVRIGPEALLPDHPRSHFARVVNNAPAGGETVRLDPPRFRWWYHPEGTGGGLLEFRFQIAADRDFRRPLVDVTTPYNFYNALAPLGRGGRFHWRVGYVDRTGPTPAPLQWSPVRSFRIAADAAVWDRSMLARPDFSRKPHPRILLGGPQLARLRRLVRDDAAARGLLERVRRRADEALAAGWYRDFPATDSRPAGERFLTMAHGLCHVAFMHRLTGEAKYGSVIQRAVTMASYPKGGLASPQPMGESREDATQTTELLGLLYDWLHPDLTDRQRRTFVESLSWRIDHFVNSFAWKRRRGGRAMVLPTWSMATLCGSHQFEGFWDTFPAALACYEDSPEARECFDLGVNWLVGVSSGHGFDEGWNEGPGYGGSKFRWLMHSVAYLDSVFPELGIGRHPWLDRMGQWFCRVAPVGLKHAPWGHGSNRESYFRGARDTSFLPLACLTGNGVFLRNWQESSGGDLAATDRAWINLAVPALRPRPTPALERDPVGVFPLAGWVMAGTLPPSSRECYEKSVGMIFACRPAGSHSHSFCAENSFHVYGYGEDLTHGAGSSDPEPYSGHSMSHNTVLIDGIGQVQRHWRDRPRLGFLRAFARGEGYVYWAGDATGAYPPRPSRPRGYWGRFDELYERRDAAHLRRFIRHVLFLRGRHFVIFDDLAASRAAKFSWLYHVLPGEPLRFDPKTWTIDYRVGKVPVRVVHAAGTGDLELIDQKGMDGYRNPLTGEDYSRNRGRLRRPPRLVCGHNLYVSNKTPAKEFGFLCVIAPAAPGARPPVIRRLDDRTVQVGRDVVSFDPAGPHKANFVIDAPALRAEPPKPEWYEPPPATAPAEGTGP